MPGKHSRERNSKALSRRESMIAKNTLKSHYQYENGSRQWNSIKEKLVNKVNNIFKNEKLDPIYTTRKLDDFLSNKLYSDKKKKREITEFDNLVPIDFSKLKLLPELNEPSSNSSPELNEPSSNSSPELNECAKLLPNCNTPINLVTIDLNNIQWDLLLKSKNSIYNNTTFDFL